MNRIDRRSILQKDTQQHTSGDQKDAVSARQSALNQAETVIAGREWQFEHDHNSPRSADLPE